MNFDWKEYVKIAEDLAKNQSESYLRSAISRAYYGIFCLSRNKKRFKNYKLEKGENIHWKVINEYKNSSSPNDKFVGKFLDDLRKERNDADYDEDKNINKDLAERVIYKAKEILKML